MQGRIRVEVVDREATHTVTPPMALDIAVTPSKLIWAAKGI
jgi:hypothetical protein